MHSFTPESARGLDLAFAADRAAAAERAAAMPWPTAEDEIWRYSRIGGLDLEAFVPGPLESTVSGDAGLLAAAATLDTFPDLIGGDAPDVFAELNAAFGDPIVVTHHVPAAGTAVFPRLLVDVGEDAEVTVVERFTSADATVLVVPVVQLHAGRAGRVRYLGVNELSVQAWQIGHQQAIGDADSTTTLSTVALGGHYARLRTEARLAGPGGSTKQTALYFAGGTQMHDFRTIQDHDAPHTTSDLLFKGAVQDQSASVYTGLIKVRPHAGGTAAFQTNRNLTLGEGAWAESVPNLDIKTNDVRCSHASTVGPIDPEHRFYLESRGVPAHVADRLIVLGFFDEVLSQLPLPALAADLRARVAAKLDVSALGKAA